MIEKYVDAEELKRLLSTLFAVVGALVIAGLFASIVVPGLRNANKPPAPMPVSPVVGEPGWLDPTEYPPEKGREIPPVDPKVLIAYAPEWIARGNVVFTANCVPCHGELGRGDGPAAASMNPRPRDFTNSTGWTNGYDLPAIFKTLSIGVKGTSMAAFDYLSKSDRMAVAHYVQVLGTFSHGTGSDDALAALSKELAAAGEKTPNRIPVSSAMTRLVQEYRVPAPLSVAPEDQSPAAELLRRVIMDPSRAALSLAGSKSWRESPQALAASVLPGIPANGFSTNLATLSSAGWQVLHEALLKIMPVQDQKQESQRDGWRKPN
jgi:mono/diheme cytochrome c family protein